MDQRNLVVIGGSSGSVDAALRLLARLPEDLPAAVFFVHHVAASEVSYLATILARSSRLPVRPAEDRLPIEPGRVYVGQPDRHLLIDTDRMYLSKGPRENRVRPAIDPLFRSAALSHGSRVIGVVLSGALDDGSVGLLTIKAAGGVALVQNPDDAITPDMPRSALDYVEADHIGSAEELASHIARIVTDPVVIKAKGNGSGNGGPVAVGQEAVAGHVATGNGSQGHGAGNADLVAARRELRIARQESGTIEQAELLGEPAALSCPECGGPLWEMREGFPRFRCHIGHAFTARHLAVEMEEAEENSLWAALRVMEERARLLRRLANQEVTKHGGNSIASKSFGGKADEAEEHVERLRGLLASL